MSDWTQVICWIEPPRKKNEVLRTTLFSTFGFLHVLFLLPGTPSVLPSLPFPSLFWGAWVTAGANGQGSCSQITECVAVKQVITSSEREGRECQDQENRVSLTSHWLPYKILLLSWDIIQHLFLREAILDSLPWADYPIGGLRACDSIFHSGPMDLWPHF